ncbi:MAG: bifunctional 3-deoxy-7-phosphoheptulonate synthase/chorismate mutase type II [Paludibacteraceae bacterium]|nr:bifunctional 3-deoxy-7-phosphoheptulonate synthase/chorismate mutase type II [Paludibacteraceae bacterium]
MKPKTLLIAGPCSAESREQVIQTAEAMKQAGADIFRAGLWKPRTSPHSFRGVGETGIAWLVEAQETFGLPVATEVAIPEHLSLCVKAGIRNLWIGARTTANPFMVQQLADALQALDNETKSSICMMVKNPINPDLDTWCGAIERIRKAGISNIVAIHRGFSDSLALTGNTMRNDALWSIPLSLHRLMPDILLVNDPSHLTGDRQLVGRLSQQALDLGFEGLMIEVHPEPDKALSDAKQQLSIEEAQALLRSLVYPSGIDKGGAALSALRRQIDEIDDSIWRLIEERQRVSAEIGELKHKAGMTIYQEERFREILSARLSWARQRGISEDAVNRIVNALHEISINMQLKK